MSDADSVAILSKTHGHLVLRRTSSWFHIDPGLRCHTQKHTHTPHAETKKKGVLFCLRLLLYGWLLFEGFVGFVFFFRFFFFQCCCFCSAVSGHAQSVGMKIALFLSARPRFRFQLFLAEAKCSIYLISAVFSILSFHKYFNDGLKRFEVAFLGTRCRPNQKYQRSVSFWKAFAICSHLRDRSAIYVRET